MDTASLAPPINLIEDFQNLQLLIFADQGGERTRPMVAYFDAAAQKSLELHTQSTDYEQKEFARLIHEAFVASKRIVLTAWEKAHGSTLGL